MAQLQKKFFRFGLLFAARIAGAGALFATNLLIANYLGFEELAKYAVFISLVSILAVIIPIGFSSIAPIFVAEYSVKKQPGFLKGFVQTALKQSTITLSTLCLGLIVIYIFSDELHIIKDYEMTLAILAAASASAIIGFNGAFLVGLKMQVAALLPDTILRPVLFSGLCFAFITTQFVTEINQIMWLYALTVWIILGFVLLRDKKVYTVYSGETAFKEQSRWRNAALPWTGISLLWDFMIDLLLLVTSILAGSIEIAILHICFRYRVLAGFGMRTIHTLFMPEITERMVDQDQHNVARKLFFVNLVSFAYACSTVAAFTMFGEWLLNLFSKDANSSVAVLVTISATMIVRAIFGPAPHVLAVHGHHLITLIISIFSMISAFGILILTFEAFGLMAVALTYTGSNLFVSATLWYFARKKTDIDCSIFASLFQSRNDFRKTA